MKGIVLYLAFILCAIPCLSQQLSFTDMQKASALEDSTKFSALAASKGFVHTSTRPAIGYVYITTAKKAIAFTDSKGNKVNDNPQLTLHAGFGAPEISYITRSKGEYNRLLNEFKSNGYKSTDDINGPSARWTSPKFNDLVLTTSIDEDYDHPGNSLYTITVQKE